MRTSVDNIIFQVQEKTSSSATTIDYSPSADHKKVDAKSLFWAPVIESSSCQLPWQHLACVKVENNQDLPVMENCANKF